MRNLRERFERFIDIARELLLNSLFRRSDATVFSVSIFFFKIFKFSVNIQK